MELSQRQNEFSEHIQAHYDQMFGFILSLVHNVNDANDVFQETSLTLWDKFDEFDPGTNFAAWGCTVARYKVLEFLDRKKRRGVWFSDEVVDQLTEIQVAEDSERLTAQRTALSECIEKLSEPQRQLLGDCYDDAKTVREVSEGLGRSTHSVYSSLKNIRSKLMDCVERSLVKEDRP